MKCATVTIECPEGNDSDFESLPTMFRANSGNGCIVPENTDAIAFKNPGANLVVAPNYTPTPIPCDSSQPGTSSPQSTTDSSDSTATNPSQSGTSTTNSTMTTPPQPSTSANLSTANTNNSTASNGTVNYKRSVRFSHKHKHMHKGKHVHKGKHHHG
jgi:hypothetical protein